MRLQMINARPSRKLARLALAVFGLTLASTAIGAPRKIEGSVNKVRDVDTIVAVGTPVGLNGVDGAELGTKVGQDTRRWMLYHLRDKIVACDLSGERTCDRWVGECYLDRVDIGAASIAAGYALDCPRYSGGRYKGLEAPSAKSRIKRAKYCN
ncbi:thermonuclease family protein [Shimia aestuarii]|nr:thermonuclease family protein [Shimia aestuarii]